ncbi:MAG: YbjQ family protein [Holophagae bacterium]|nr:YbjQ family protein [Holophagae bacterium]
MTLVAPPQSSKLPWLGRQLGANAVVGVRYDATELMQGLSEALCDGTAAVVQAG